jgi:hypothetical protein
VHERHGLHPRTGLCEARSVTDVCAEAPGGGTRCVPLEIGKKEAAPPGSTLPIGISPATGTVPPPPNESSPRAP